MSRTSIFRSTPLPWQEHIDPDIAVGDEHFGARSVIDRGECRSTQADRDRVLAWLGHCCGEATQRVQDRFRSIPGEDTDVDGIPEIHDVVDVQASDGDLLADQELTFEPNVREWPGRLGNRGQSDSREDPQGERTLFVFRSSIPDEPRMGPDGPVQDRIGLVDVDDFPEDLCL